MDAHNIMFKPTIFATDIDDTAVERARLLQAQKDLSVIAEAADGRQAVEKARRYKPNVILMDINLPEMNGVESTVAIRRDNPDVHIIALSLYNEQWMIERMLKAGACRYLTKNVPAEELLQAIREVVADNQTETV